eukprot:scaffold42849_cov49-Attheya_sp.AAC.1
MTARMSQADVASLLCVPEGGLALIILSDEICTAKGCNAVAVVKSNYHKCAFHGKKWLTCKHAAAGGKELLMNRRRGYKLLQPLRGVDGCGACGKWKGRNDGKRGETVFWGDTKPVVVMCGAAGCRKRVDRMRSKLD